MNSTEIKKMLQERHDFVGECDTCHNEPVQLWIDHDSPGEFSDCFVCWTKKARSLKSKEAKGANNEASQRS